jgi:hypothetical protein
MAAIIARAIPCRRPDDARRRGCGKAHGWQVRDIVRTVLPKVRLIAVEIVSTRQRNVVPRAELESDAALPLIRINRRGQLGFEIWRKDAAEVK